MTEQMHTPGPWHVEIGRLPADGAPVFGFAIRASEEHGKWHSVAGHNVYEHHNNACFTPEEIEANARLIASAPALLDALRESVLTIEWLYGIGTIARDAKDFDPQAWEEAMRYLVSAREAIRLATEGTEDA